MEKLTSHRYLREIHWRDSCFSRLPAARGFFHGNSRFRATGGSTEYHFSSCPCYPRIPCARNRSIRNNWNKTEEIKKTLNSKSVKSIYTLPRIILHRTVFNPLLREFLWRVEENIHIYMAVSLLKNERGHEIRILHPCGNASLMKSLKRNEKT